MNQLQILQVHKDTITKYFAEGEEAVVLKTNNYSMCIHIRRQNLFEKAWMCFSYQVCTTYQQLAR